MQGAMRKHIFSVLLLALMTAFAAGCSAESPSTLSTASTNATAISGLFYFIFWVAVVVFIIVESLLLYSVIRFRRKSDSEMPTQVHGNTKLEIMWTLAPAIVLAVVFVLTYQTLMAMATVPKDSLQVKVTGHQWWWEIEYPDLGIVTANEIHIPVAQSSQFNLESKDVIHSFWVPELNGKTDLVPGHKNVTWIQPTRIGTYRAQCAEFCGAEHADMRFSVVVESKADFDAWAAQQKQKAVTSDTLTKGMATFTQLGCFACHTIDGTTAQGKVGPNLTHVGSRKTIAAGVLEMNPANLRAWITNPQGIKPGVAMPTLAMTPDQADALSAMLQALK